MLFHSLEEIKLTDKDFAEKWRFLIFHLNEKYFLAYIDDNISCYVAEVPDDYLIAKFDKIEYVNDFGILTFRMDDYSELDFVIDTIKLWINNALEAVIKTIDACSIAYNNTFGCNHQQSLVNQGIHWCALNNENYPNCEDCKDFSKRPDSITYYNT